ncbi:hypothetical protein D3C73_552970 [compost metagenome]
MSSMFILQLIFLLSGTATAAAGKHAKSASAISAAVLLGAYVLSSAVDLNAKLVILRYLTPFAYFKADHLLTDGGMSPIYIILSMVIIATLLGMTYIYYKKRDLHV